MDATEYAPEPWKRDDTDPCVVVAMNGEPVATFTDPWSADRAVRAVNACAGAEKLRGFGEAQFAQERRGDVVSALEGAVDGMGGATTAVEQALSKLRQMEE